MLQTLACHLHTWQKVSEFLEWDNKPKKTQELQKAKAWWREGERERQSKKGPRVGLDRGSWQCRCEWISYCRGPNFFIPLSWVYYTPCFCFHSILIRPCVVCQGGRSCVFMHDPRLLFVHPRMKNWILLQFVWEKQKNKVVIDVSILHPWLHLIKILCSLYASITIVKVKNKQIDLFVYLFTCLFVYWFVCFFFLSFWEFLFD